MMCIRCDELEEEVAWLRSELGIQTELTVKSGLARSLGLSPGELSVVLALYRANGRVVPSSFIEETIPSTWGRAGDRCDRLVAVYVCRIRKALGAGVIETVCLMGYQLTSAGREIIRGALEGEQAVAA